ncbi:MAG: serine hydrolase [Deltaproteobacteria bacterium]|nr:serine hydrolase [Deltaproteobacteria bacterium]
MAAIVVVSAFLGAAFGSASRPCAPREAECRDFSAWLGEIVEAERGVFRVNATVVDTRDVSRRGSVDGGKAVYPASVVKLVYLVALMRRLDAGSVRLTVDFAWNVEEMVRHSHNPAAGRLMDVVTKTSQGRTLAGGEFEEFRRRRRALEDEMARLGAKGIRAHDRIWTRVSARDKQLRRADGTNAMSTEATANLLVGIARCAFLSAARCQQVQFLLKRHVNDESDPRFLPIGRGLPVGARFWSKPGLTAGTHHDAAIVELANGARFVVVVFLRGKGSDGSVISRISSRVARGFE